MSDSPQSEIRATIDLTTKLEQSLRKLLTNKKKLSVSLQNSPFEEEFSSQLNKSQRQQLQKLREENRQLIEDNQFLSKQILVNKEQSRQLKREVSNCKKYIKFLQDYNDDLKKQMMFWMKKSQKDEIPRKHSTVTELMSQMIKLRKQNQNRELQLKSLKQTIQLKQERNQGQAHIKEKYCIYDRKFSQMNNNQITTKGKNKNSLCKSHSKHKKPQNNFSSNKKRLKNTEINHRRHSYFQSSLNNFS